MVLQRDVGPAVIVPLAVAFPSDPAGPEHFPAQARHDQVGETHEEQVLAAGRRRWLTGHEEDKEDDDREADDHRELEEGYRLGQSSHI